MKLKKLLTMGLAVGMAFSMLAVTGCGSDKTAGKNKDTFSWWIYTTDAVGTYYDKYEDNPGVQWLNQQYWDTETGTIGTEENGTNIQFSFQAPIAGAEKDNFNTMLSTGEYADIIDLSPASDTAETLCEDGVLMEITEYVEKYCPNYVAFLDENPEQKALVTTTDEDGKVHYYKMAGIKDGNDVPWGGYVYRRDWVVKYAQPTEYIWDWDSEYVKEHGHPAVTPLSEAKKTGNLEGWKKNSITKFTSSEGDDPANDYEDNVIFPSGKTDPYTISDWEWMFEAFQKAIDERSFAGDGDAYCTTVYYPGYLSTGDLVSSFGGGNGIWSKDEEQNVYFSGTSDNFRTYLECLHTWNEKGWMDQKFETRASDIFFSINQNGTSRGMVGLWYSYISSLGDSIRVTCEDPEDQKSAYVMGCAAPVNDVYGTEEQKYKEPDAFYQGSRVGGSVGITTAAKGKDLEALFTFFNWLYSEEGALTKSWGLSKEQLSSCEIENNLYEEYGYDGAYEITEDQDGMRTIRINYPVDGDVGGALKFLRLGIGIDMTGSGPDLNYVLDKNQSKVVDHALEQFSKYVSTASLLDYNAQFSEEQNKTYSQINTSVNDYMAQKVPSLIKEGLGGWDAYTEGVDALNADDLTSVYQDVVDKSFGK